jgi:hypothetical protein
MHKSAADSWRKNHGMSRIRVKNLGDEIVVTSPGFKVVLSAAFGGTPSWIGFSGTEPISTPTSPMLSARLGGRKIVPFIDGEMNADIVKNPDAGCVSVTIHDTVWRAESDDHAAPAPGFRTALVYEFWHDGVTFVKTFFHAETLDPVVLDRFVLDFGVQLGSQEECDWAFWKFPGRNVDAADIQGTGSFERLIPKGENRTWKNSILPFFSFDFGEGVRRDRHFECFVESWNAVSGHHRNTETRIDWQKAGARIQWDFQKMPHRKPGRACQWRNTWGWAMRQFPRERCTMPPRIYHYLDMFQRYPETRQIAGMAREGATLLILHEGWRLDAKQGEFPYDNSALKRVAAACRKHGLRLALYVRGNEDQILEDAGRSLAPYLRHDVDGIYMDYGSAWSFVTHEDESAPGGRIKLRAYDLKMRRVRDFVGPNGVLISHTGSFFSAVGQTVCDLYLGGEQEKGRLLESRDVHAYFSGLSICPTSLWTAAFPTYRTRKMLPFLVSTAQAPFLHLGCQFPASSLNHPHIPSLVNFVRPLWRMWTFFESPGGVTVFSDQNTPPEWLGIRSPNTGAVAFVNAGGDMLLMATNFSEQEHELSLCPHWVHFGLGENMRCVELDPEKKPHPAYREIVRHKECVSAVVGGYGLIGWLFTRSLKKWGDKLTQFVRPYPKPTREEEVFRERLNAERERRLNPPAWKRVFIRVRMFNFPNTYEDSIWWDLFDNTVELVELRGANTKRLGYITSTGLSKTAPKPEHYLWPGVVSPWIALHDIPGLRGRRSLAFRTRKGKLDFYSWVAVEVSDRAATTERTYELEYNNEIDLDWSVLEFSIEMGCGAPPKK